MQLLEIKTWWSSGVYDFSSRPPRLGPFQRQYTVLLTKLTQSPNPKIVNRQRAPKWHRNDPCRKSPAMKIVESSKLLELCLQICQNN